MHSWLDPDTFEFPHTGCGYYCNMKLWNYTMEYKYDGGDWKSDSDPQFAKPDGITHDTTYSFLPKRWIKENQVVDFFLKSRDGYNIHSWYVQGKPGMPAVIIGHGHFMSMGKWEVAHKMHILYHYGYTVMGIEFRNHGLSDFNKEKMLTWGAQEHLEYLSAMDWLIKEKGFTKNKIGIVGNSMSGGIATIAMAKEPALRAAWVDSPASNYYGVLSFGFVTLSGPPSALFGLLASPAAAKVWQKIGEAYASAGLIRDEWLPEELAKTYKKGQNIFIVSAKQDWVVPTYLSQSIVDGVALSAGKAEIWKVDLAPVEEGDQSEPWKDYAWDHIVEEVFYEGINFY